MVNNQFWSVAAHVLAGLPYSTAIDVWSFACILAELYTGYPLFPAETEDDLMICVVQVLGLPPKSIMQTSSRVKHFFGTPRESADVQPGSLSRR